MSFAGTLCALMDMPLPGDALHAMIVESASG